MKLFIGVIICLFLAGCHSEVEKWEIDQGEKLCENHGGLITIETVISIKISCADGREFFPLRPE